MQIVKLKAFSKFDSTVDALTSTAAIVDSKLPKGSRLQTFSDGCLLLHNAHVRCQELLHLSYASLGTHRRR